MRISDWSSDVCSSDLAIARDVEAVGAAAAIISVVETGIGAHRAQPRHVIEQIAPDRIRTVGEPAGKRLRHRIEQDLRGPDRRGVEEDDARLMDAALDRKSTRLNSSH